MSAFNDVIERRILLLLAGDFESSVCGKSSDYFIVSSEINQENIYYLIYNHKQNENSKSIIGARAPSRQFESIEPNYERWQNQNCHG